MCDQRSPFLLATRLVVPSRVVCDCVNEGGGKEGEKERGWDCTVKNSVSSTARAQRSKAWFANGGRGGGSMVTHIHTLPSPSVRAPRRFNCGVASVNERCQGPAPIPCRFEIKGRGAKVLLFEPCLCMCVCRDCRCVCLFVFLSFSLPVFCRVDDDTTSPYVRKVRSTPQSARWSRTQKGAASPPHSPLFPLQPSFPAPLFVLPYQTVQWARDDHDRKKKK
jgi:hypothetical protein